MSSEDSCSHPDDSELELGLGLSIGGGKATAAAADGGGSWYQYAKILTDKDFPSSSSSSSSSSSPVAKINNNGLSAISNQVAGWPPIGTHRMNTLMNHAKSPATEESTSSIDKCKSTKNITADNKANYSLDVYNNVAKERGLVKKASLFVKVNVDGVSIGRKVDLNAHSCYETLACALDRMFTLGHVRLLDGLSDFVLTYKDKDGDWMLVGDVPWEMFLSSVRRLRIRRRNEANGLAPRSQERNTRHVNTPV